MSRVLRYTKYLVLFLIVLTLFTARAQTRPSLSNGSQAPGVTRIAQAETSNSSMESTENGQRCTTVTFEGLADNARVPAIQGINFNGWLSLIDADAGGNGNFANEPTPETIMFWLGSDPSIVLNNPASKIEFFYSTSVTLTVTAFDQSNNQIAQIIRPANYSGCPGDPTGAYGCWTPLTVEVSGRRIKRLDVIGGPNFTGFDNFKVCTGLTVDSVELTQAIQQWQPIADLKADLQPDREPPVPIIADKPAVFRVYMEEVSAVAQVTVEVSGAITGSKTLWLIPECTPGQRRLAVSGCASADFYVTPPAGNFDITVKVKDSSNNITDSHDLPFKARTAESLKLKAVSICDAKDGSGNWLCASAADLTTRAGILRRIAPTARVVVETTSNHVERETSAFPTVDGWWSAAVGDLANLYTIFDSASAALGTTVKYFGMIRPGLPGGAGGMADRIPGNGAGSRTSVIRLGGETASEVVAHETGHTLGLRHTNQSAPIAGAAPPGCYNTALDGGTDWPFLNNRVQSTARLEVGFDVVARTVFDPQNTFDLMSYCVPRWISPQRYKTLITSLSGGAVTSASSVKAPALVNGPFWLVSGKIVNSAVEFDPLFTFNGGPDMSQGTYRVEVVDIGGSVLASRSFIPFTPDAERADPTTTTGPTLFSVLTPQVPGAARLVIRSSSNQIVGSLTLGGILPVAQLISPTAPANLGGTVNLTWTITDADSTNHATRVQYSSDNGQTWSEIGVVGAHNLAVNFDQLPGSSQAQIKLIVSDGINSSAAIFGPFTVAKKNSVAATILSPANGAVLQPGNPLFLEGVATDIDDGALIGPSLVWSAAGGNLGFGELVPATLPSGPQTITLKATDRDGNTSTKSVNVMIAGAPPLVNLSIRALDSLPTTCVEATIVVTASGLPPSQADYSLNGGSSWTPIPLNRLPFRFTVPGSGFFHLITRAFDASGQFTADDAQFFTSAACTTGTPGIVGALGNHGVNNGKYFVDVTFSNSGAGIARAVTMNSIRVVPIGGGSASIDETMTGSLPLLIGDIAAGTSRTLRIWLNLSGVTRFSLSQSGTLTDFGGTRFLSFSLSQAITLTH